MKLLSSLKPLFYDCKSVATMLVSTSWRFEAWMVRLLGLLANSPTSKRRTEMTHSKHTH